MKNFKLSILRVLPIIVIGFLFVKYFEYKSIHNITFYQIAFEYPIEFEAFRQNFDSAPPSPEVLNNYISIEGEKLEDWNAYLNFLQKMNLNFYKDDTIFIIYSSIDHSKFHPKEKNYNYSDYNFLTYLFDKDKNIIIYSEPHGLRSINAKFREVRLYNSIGLIKNDSLINEITNELLKINISLFKIDLQKPDFSYYSDKSVYAEARLDNKQSKIFHCCPKVLIISKNAL